MTHNYLDTFITTMIAERGYEKSPKEVKEQLHKDLAERLDTFIMTRTVSEFSKEELTEFEKLLDDNKSTKELTHFAKKHIPDYQTFMTSTLLLFQDAYLS